MKFGSFTLAAVLFAGVAFAAGTSSTFNFLGINGTNATSIEAALNKLPGVASAKVDAKTGAVTLTAKDGAHINEATVASTVNGITGAGKGATTGTGTTTTTTTTTPAAPAAPAHK
ncbi:MAG: heavy-metal-associated domain-containing protein [Deltaproteobacteria bacterium]|nr:heavy-metal-associated domain-containing protein [Deltaproteobacteria bacterium]